MCLLTVKSVLFIFSFLFPPLKFKERWNGVYIHGGGFVDERDRGPSCCEQFVFYPRDRDRDNPYNLRCPVASSNGGCTTGGCTVQQVGPIRMSTKHSSIRDCLCELLTRIQQDHGSDCVATVQPWQVVSSEDDLLNQQEGRKRVGGSEA